MPSEHESERDRYPRSLTERERAWCAWLLPRERAAYAALAEALETRLVLGHGRWGEGDLVLGVPGQSIDLQAPMEPVAAYGEVTLDGGAVLSISIHHPDEEERIEVHLSGADLHDIDDRAELSRWCFSYWSPGEPSPASGSAVREVVLDRDDALRLVLDPSRRVMWMHDAMTEGCTLVPVTNYYNELMLLKGIRDPAIALDHRRLFEHTEENTDAELRAAFVRYNATWRKVDAARLGVAEEVPREQRGILAAIARAMKGGRKA